MRRSAMVAVVVAAGMATPHEARAQAGASAPVFAGANAVALVPQACTVSLRGLADPAFSPSVEAQGDVACNLPVTITAQSITYIDTFTGQVLASASGPVMRGFTGGMRDNRIVGANGYRRVRYCATLTNGDTTRTACATGTPTV